MQRRLLSGILFCLLYFTMLVPVQAQAPAWVTVNKEGIVWGKDILLGSIANISCADSQRYQALVNMDLGYLGQPGAKRTLTEYVLQLKIRSSGVDISNITWSIPPTVTVVRASQTLTGAQLGQAAEAAIKKQLLANGEKRKWTLKVLGTPRDMILPPGPVAFDAQLPFGVNYSAPTLVYVYLKVKGEPAGRAVCRLQLDVYGDVVTAAHFVKANQPLTMDDLRVVSKPINNNGSTYITDPTMAVGRISYYPLEPGEILRDDILAKPIIIQVGSRIYIEACRGPIVAQAEGIAQSNGRKGEYIKVRNVKTGAVLSGKVIDSHSVQVDMAD